MKFQSTKEDRLSLELTIYQGGFGLVKEARRLDSAHEVDGIQFIDVAETIDTDSIMLDGIAVQEQNFEFDLADHQRLLSKYIGQVVAIRYPELDEEMEMRLLNTAGGIAGECLETGRIFLNPAGDLVLPALPEGLYKQPTISWEIASAKLDHDLYLSYLAQGLEWESVYVVKVGDETLSLTGWAKISNRTGMDFTGAELKLVAGKVHRLSKPALYPLAEFSLQNNRKREVSFEEHAFSDYHVYRFGGPAALRNGQSKQIRFLSAESIKFKKVYTVNRMKRGALIEMHFANTADAGIGMPLPPGIAKVYGIDADGKGEFVGEDAISPTPQDGQVALVLGEAFDIHADSRETSRERQEGLEYITYVYELANRKEENVRIDIIHQFHELNWKMESSTHDYEVNDAETIGFKVWLGAGKEVSVEFTYQVDQRRVGDFPNRLN